MAAFDTTRASYASVDVLGRLGQTFNDMIARLAAWNDARVTRRALAQLSDRELDDIGLIRGDIDNVANITR